MTTISTETTRWLSELLNDTFTIQKHTYAHQDEVYKLQTTENTYYLKLGKQLAHERDNLKALQAHLLVPQVVGFTKIHDQLHLLMTELPGKNLAEYIGQWSDITIVKEFARAVRVLHTQDANVLFPGKAQPGKVLLHGDMALPNIICTEPGAAGYIDLAQMSVGTPDKDLADALWSLQRNMSPAYGELFLQEYGPTTMTPHLEKALKFRYKPE